MKFYNVKKQPIGDVVDNVFYKRVQKSKHLMRIYNAWGIDESVLNQIKGCNEIRILDTEENIVYATVPKDFMEKGIRKDFDGPQVFLPIKYFSVEWAGADKPRQEKLINVKNEKTNTTTNSNPPKNGASTIANRHNQPNRKEDNQVLQHQGGKIQADKENISRVSDETQ